MRNVKRPATTTLTGVAPRRTHAARRLPGAMAAAVATILAPLALSSVAVAANDNVPAQIVGQVPGYSPAVANEEGYWYSRYSMMTPTMQSGMGVTIPMDQRFMGMVQHIEHQGEVYSRHFHWLRDFALGHVEAAEIFAAID